MTRSEQDSIGDETIVAVITPPGEGGLAALRLAGPACRRLLRRCFRPKRGQYDSITPFMLRYGEFVDREGRTVDEITAVFQPKGQSYTGLDQVEIFCHGGRLVVRLIQDELLELGARAAQPGEFTRLAFLNGRIDLARAEAVAEIIAAGTDRSYQASRDHLLGRYSEEIGVVRDQLVAILAEVEATIDFSEEDVDPAESQRLVPSVDRTIEVIDSLVGTYKGGRIISEGYTVAIGGRPNAGKSSLFNLLLRQERALVNPRPGTTRDYLSEWIDLGGVAVNLIDTAGLRGTGGSVEQQGQQRALDIISRADLVLWMADLSDRKWVGRLSGDLKKLPGGKTLLIGNKIDLVDEEIVPPEGMVVISCLTRRGIKSLTKELATRIERTMPDLTSGVVVTSARHKQKLTHAVRELKKARQMLRRGESPELTSVHLRAATAALDEITGKVYTEEILGRIFSRFCVGK